jgi:predicted ester cyclase
LTRHKFARMFAGVVLIGSLGLASCARSPEPEPPATPAHTPESNKAVMRRWIEEGHNRDNLKLLDETFAASYVAHLADGKTADFAKLREVEEGFHRDFADIHITIHDMVAEGDRVVTRSTIAATHRASGKRMDVTAMSLARFETGKVVEDWMNMDELRMMTQLGLLPPPGQSQAPDAKRR